MRPNFTNLKGIKEVLNLARAQAKLTQMETLTWYAGLKAVEKQDQAGALGQTERLFINSIASACMSKGGGSGSLEPLRPLSVACCDGAYGGGTRQPGVYEAEDCGDQSVERADRHRRFRRRIQQ